MDAATLRLPSGGAPGTRADTSTADSPGTPCMSRVTSRVGPPTISGWLVIASWRTPTTREAKRLYKFSVAFPYVAGAVAGVQLVTGITLGVYP